MFILTSLLQLLCHRVILTWGIYFPRDGLNPHFPNTWMAGISSDPGLMHELRMENFTMNILQA